MGNGMVDGLRGWSEKQGIGAALAGGRGLGFGRGVGVAVRWRSCDL